MSSAHRVPKVPSPEARAESRVHSTAWSRLSVVYMSLPMTTKQDENRYSQKRGIRLQVLNNDGSDLSMRLASSLSQQTLAHKTWTLREYLLTVCFDARTPQVLVRL